MKAELLIHSQCFLGEGPFWYAEKKLCLWVDIENCRLFAYDWVNAAVRSWSFDHNPSLIVEDLSGHLLLGMSEGIARFNLENGQPDWVVALESEQKDRRTNDGACDSEGRLWVGTMHLNCLEGQGSLYCIDQDRVPVRRLEKNSIPNGLVWSKDNSRMYYIDSPKQSVQSFLFDPKSGSIQYEKDIIQIPRDMGAPDGMAIDREGLLWIAHWGGSGVYRWDPSNGKCIDKIEVAAPHVTSCAFVGEDLDHLFITSARQELTKDQLDQFPASGDCFLVKPGVRGLPVHACRI
ncbi:MAG: SMP-30/gluconolactonase/LRE family protein [Chitinophagales bacterium]